MLKIIGKCDVKHILTLPIETITSVVNVSTYNIISIIVLSFGLATTPVTMSVSAFTAVVILYIFYIKLFVVL